MCVLFFFAISFSHSSGFFPFFLLFLTLQLKKTTTKHNHIQQTDSSNALLLLSETKKKPTHTSSQTHTYIDTETHTHLPQSRARRYFSNWTCSIFKKEKRGENVSAPLRITSRGLRCVRRRAALVKCSAHTLTLTHTHTHAVSTHRKCKCGMGGTGRSDVTPGLLLLLHVRSGGLLELRAGRVDGTRAHTRTRAHTDDEH